MFSKNLFRVRWKRSTAHERKMQAGCDITCSLMSPSDGARGRLLSCVGSKIIKGKYRPYSKTGYF